jgi:hypothetical protein
MVLFELVEEIAGLPRWPTVLADRAAQELAVAFVVVPGRRW